MTPRFLLDGMLGSLARWLRILGYDSVYHIDMEDDKLGEEAKETDRVLVTRDTELYNKSVKSGRKAFLIQSEHTINQLIEMAESLGISLIPLNTRCPQCNGDLLPIEKSKVEGKVPERSYLVFNDFWICLECEAVYWKGSHWIQIEETLSKIPGSKSL